MRRVLKRSAVESSASCLRVPRAASWIGAFGLVPFIALSLAISVLDGPMKSAATVALVAYGAIILSFLGGVHWGLAIADFGSPAGHHILLQRLTFSVIPSLIGWVAILLPTPANLLTLIISFLLLLAFDVKTSRVGEAPAWYPTLRWPLTLTVSVALLLAALA